MKTLYLPSNLTRSRATQLVFMTTGRWMQPIRELDSDLWSYHIAEASDFTHPNVTPLFTPIEIALLKSVCANAWNSPKFFWYLARAIGSFRPRERFICPTYNQVIPLAEQFICWTYAQINKN